MARVPRILPFLPSPLLPCLVICISHYNVNVNFLFNASSETGMSQNSTSLYFKSPPSDLQCKLTLSKLLKVVRVPQIKMALPLAHAQSANVSSQIFLAFLGGRNCSIETLSSYPKSRQPKTGWCCEARKMTFPTLS